MINCRGIAFVYRSCTSTISSFKNCVPCFQLKCLHWNLIEVKMNRKAWKWSTNMLEGWGPNTFVPHLFPFYVNPLLFPCISITDMSLSEVIWSHFHKHFILFYFILIPRAYANKLFTGATNVSEVRLSVNRYLFIHLFIFSFSGHKADY